MKEELSERKLKSFLATENPEYFLRARPEIGISAEVMLKFAKKIVKKDGCWNWTDAKSPSGYGLANINGRQIRAHRLAVLLSGRDFPEGFQADHLCRNRKCVNPDHLDVVTPRENTLRGNTITAANAKKTHCLNGHAFDFGNTRTRNGHRECRHCCRIREANRRQEFAMAYIEERAAEEVKEKSE